MCIENDLAKQVNFTEVSEKFVSTNAKKINFEITFNTIANFYYVNQCMFFQINVNSTLLSSFKLTYLSQIL